MRPAGYMSRYVAFFIGARRLGLAMLALACLSAYAVADDSDESRIVRIITDIERGWETADGAVFREHFLDFEGARYIEGGGQNSGLSDLIDHHVVPEGDAFNGFELTFANTEVHVEGNFAWAIADTEILATLKHDDQKIHYRGYATFLLREIEEEWKVVHTHSSSKPVKSETEEHQH